MPRRTRFMRRKTRQVRIGNLSLGGGAPISVQTMVNVDPHDGEACLAQVLSCADVGCDLVRLTVPDIESARQIGTVSRRSPIPLVADIHYDYRCALAALEAGVSALRLNPGNIGGREAVHAVARAASDKGVPIRIGVNGGSLEKDLSAALREGRLTRPQALVKSALRHQQILEAENFRDIVISVKASNVLETIDAYRLLAEVCDCPLHLGVTEAGTFLPGTVRSSVALGVLLAEGIGDTIRVSLTDRPEREVRVGLEILRSLGLRAPGPSVTSCPTCGRTKVDLQRVALQVEEGLEKVFKPDAKLPRVAVMGCAVNGPGEAAGADIALCGGADGFHLYVRGELVCKVPEAEAAGKVLEYAVSL